MAGYVNLPSLRMWHDERGEGEPLVLLHGGVVDSRFFEAPSCVWKSTVLSVSRMLVLSSLLSSGPRSKHRHSSTDGNEAQGRRGGRGLDGGHRPGA